MSQRKCGAEEARANLPQLLELAHHGTRTVITRHGKPYAALVPVEEARVRRRPSLLSLAGSGAGLWGEDSTRAVRKMREEW